MRPVGVKQRFLDLLADDDRYHVAHPELRLRVELTRFVNLAARQGFPDLPLSSTLDSLWTTAALLDDPAQRRTGTEFERRCIDCVQQLRRVADEFAIRHPDATPLEEDDGLVEAFVRIPPMVVLGEDGPDSHFDLICWNAANVLAEGVRRPYWAARPVVHAGFHRPADRLGLLTGLTPLTARYEDEPERRTDTAAEIAAVLADFLDAAPWPR